jgi:hypothetical protein
MADSQIGADHCLHQVALNNVASFVMRKSIELPAVMRSRRLDARAVSAVPIRDPRHQVESIPYLSEYPIVDDRTDLSKVFTRIDARLGTSR